MLGLLRWLGPLVLGGIAIPAWLWITTRYDVESAQKLTKRVGEIETALGPKPDRQLGCDEDVPPAPFDASLQDRERRVDRWVRCRDKEQARHDTLLYRRMVSIAAATTEHRPALRAAAAREAVGRFDRGIDYGDPPEKAAQEALETPIPMR